MRRPTTRPSGCPHRAPRRDPRGCRPGRRVVQRARPRAVSRATATAPMTGSSTRPLKVFDGDVPSWFEADTARPASDDPDTLFWRTNEHVFMAPTSAVEWPYGRGAVYLITEYYDKAIYHVKAGNGHQASIYIGWLAHYWADILQPYHTAYAATSKASAHAKYEQLVDDRQRSAGQRAGMADRGPQPRPGHEHPDASHRRRPRTRGPTSPSWTRRWRRAPSLTSRASVITGYLMKKASRELADMIYSIDRDRGNAPGVKTVTVTRKYAQPSSIEYQAIYVKVLDPPASRSRVPGSTSRGPPPRTYPTAPSPSLTCPGPTRCRTEGRGRPPTSTSRTKRPRRSRSR